ncbi:MAG TPA: hypothetical protein VHE30_00910 [Polyangiaceae bacterium]|nr:hypothetical protein [Polyangiaceae bacterium]
MTRGSLAAAALGALLAVAPAAARADAHLPPGPLAWRDAGGGGIRGLTVGPIESTLHPGKGYGSEPCARTMREAATLGANWVSLTPFGRTDSLAPFGVDPTFEVPFAENRKNVERAVKQAHENGLRVLLVPHLWVERGGWRGLLDPGDDAAWARFAKSYRHFVVGWAKVAAAAKVDMLSVGVELRTWVTTTHAPLFLDVIRDVKRVYGGLLTYAANWDDADDTVVWGDLDVISLNAFYPLANEAGAPLSAAVEGGARVAAKVRALAESWQKPVMFNEIGYTTRKDTTVEPWLWPDDMKSVTVDQEAQAEGYLALLAGLLGEPSFAGFFVWRVYADPDDMSQEAEWGFSPRGKLAELVMRDAFQRAWAADGDAAWSRETFPPRSVHPGRY